MFLVDQVSGHIKQFNIAIFLNTTHLINVEFYMAWLLLDRTVPVKILHQIISFYIEAVLK